MRTIYCILISFFLLSHISIVSAEGFQYENTLIGGIDIVFVGDASSFFNENTIRTSLKTQTGNAFSHVLFDEDLKMLSEDFHRVEPELQRRGDQLCITLKLYAKPILRSIRFVGNNDFCCHDLLAQLEIQPYSTFDRLAFNQAFQKLKGFYTKKGYFQAQLHYDIQKDPVTNEVDIIITVNEGRHGRIRDISFQGVTRQEERVLLDMMNTKLFNFITGWLSGEGTYHEEMVRQDEFIIADYLHNQGYADAQVCIEVKQLASNQLGLLIIVDKGPLYRFGDITFEGNEIFDTSFLCSHLAFEKGEPFSADDLRTSLQNIRDAYGHLGYIETFVNFDIFLDPTSCVYNIHFTIEESQCYRVGIIKVFGNYNTHTRLILLESLLTPGEIFNASRLATTEARLMNTNFFSNVNVYAVKSGESSIFGPDYRDVHIEVVEEKTANFSLSAAFSNVENLFGVLEITERNFNICGFRRLQRYGLSALRGAGEFFQLNATVGMKSSNYSISWVKPFIYDTPWTIGFTLAQETTRYVSSDYYFRNVGGSFNATYRLNAFMQLACYHRLKYSYTKRTGKPDQDDHDNGEDREAKSEITQAMNDTAKLLDQENGEKESDEYVKETGIRGLISAVGARFIYDTRDNQYDPLCGWSSIIGYEFAGVGGPFRFMTFSYLNAYYYPVRNWGVIRLRGDMKFIQTWGQQRYEGLPLDERLFLGEEFFVRGYRPYKIGPTFDDKNNAPRGGLSLQYISAEYAHFFAPSVEGFLFFDGGALNKSEWNFFEDMRFSVGIGTRFQLIQSLPPFTLGIGFPLNAKDRREVKRFFISVGGRF